MKKLIIILFLFIGLYSNSQVINMEPNWVSIQVGEDWVFVKTYSHFVTQSVPFEQDSVIYSMFKIPDELSERNILILRHEQDGDTILKYTNRVKIDLTYGRKLVLYQQVLKYVQTPVEKPDEDKIFFYLKKAKELEITNSQFYNYQPIQAIVNPTDSI